MPEQTLLSEEMHSSPPSPEEQQEPVQAFEVKPPTEQNLASPSDFLAHEKQVSKVKAAFDNERIVAKIILFIF